jgi:hypothetical protein
MDPSEPTYLSFLLRLWQVGRGEEGVWRMMLESPQTRELWTFSSLEALTAFLQARMEKSAPPDDQSVPEIK